jgi:predicted helicase
MAADAIVDYHFVGGGATSVELARHRYLPSGNRIDNITDWALAQFCTRYAAEAPDLTKDDIFAYVYAVLHDPLYRTTYAADLRREFPRIPLYDGFARWAAWGRTLLDLHIGYETVAPADLTRVDVPTGKPPTPKLKSLPENGVIVLDSDTQLTGVPRAAWDYRLGNRSAIDWVLDQHKEKKIKDPTVARLFDTYRFADHKERVIDLLARVVTVSVATVAITEAMAGEPRS